jgi:CRP-like cAMP-binding protein
MTLMRTALLLRACPMFADLDEAEMAALDAIALRREFRRNGTIFRQGEVSRGFFVVVSGAVKIFRIGPDGRERVLHVVGPAETFAEAAIFMDAYPADAAALAAGTVVVQIDKVAFKNLLTHDSRMTLKIIGSLVRWLREARDALTDLTLKEVPARFASYVLSLPATGNDSIPMSIGKTTVAQMIGTTKETFSRLLHRLAARRILTWRNDKLRILNRPRLQRISEGIEKI